MKKSTANSDVLPDNWLLGVAAGTPCTLSLSSKQAWEGYYLCSLA